MATDEPKPPEGFNGGPSIDDGDIATVELSPGETLQGTLVGTFEGEGEYGPYVKLRINADDGVVEWYAKDEAKTMWFADDLDVGDELWIGKSTDEEEIQGQDATYYPTLCRVKED